MMGRRLSVAETACVGKENVYILGVDGFTTARRRLNATIHIKGNLLWKWGRTESGNYFAVCDPIAQTVQAGEFADLLASISEALDSTFRDLLSSGDLEQFLRDRGWSSELPGPRESRNVRFDVPFELKGVQRRDLKEAIC